jgi:hypothetical protein
MNFLKAMKRMPLVFCIFLVLGALATLPRTARASEWNEKTIVTFSGPVEIPGPEGRIALPPGTYVFQLLDSQSDRDIVQVFNKDETQLYATINGIPDYRPQPTAKTVMKFNETGAYSPEALTAWFYPGTDSGVEFVYPKSQALETTKCVS